MGCGTSVMFELWTECVVPSVLHWELQSMFSICYSKKLGTHQWWKSMKHDAQKQKNIDICRLFWRSHKNLNDQQEYLGGGTYPLMKPLFIWVWCYSAVLWEYNLSVDVWLSLTAGLCYILGKLEFCDAAHVEILEKSSPKSNSRIVFQWCHSHIDEFLNTSSYTRRQLSWMS